MERLSEEREQEIRSKAESVRGKNRGADLTDADRTLEVLAELDAVRKEREFYREQEMKAHKDCDRLTLQLETARKALEEIRASRSWPTYDARHALARIQEMVNQALSELDGNLNSELWPLCPHNLAVGACLECLELE